MSPSGRLAESTIFPVYNAGIFTKIESPPPHAAEPSAGDSHTHNHLAPAFVRTAPPGHHIDGDGLYLYVQPTGARSWIQRLVIRGWRSELGLGPVAPVSPAEAREGGDPLADKRRVQGIPTFAKATVTAGRSGLLLR